MAGPRPFRPWAPEPRCRESRPRRVVSRSPNGAAFSGQTAVQSREIMAQKIFLVTGATGATGGYAVERLLERGHAVRNGLFKEHCRAVAVELQEGVVAGTDSL